MKINDFKFIDSKNRTKFRDVLNLNLKEYVAWYNEKQPKNKPFKDLYDEVVDYLKLPHKEEYETPKTIDPIVVKLNKIPTNEIRFYVKNTNYNTVSRFLPTLGALYEFKSDFRNRKRPRWHNDALSYQETLKEKCDTIIENYLNFELIKSIPATINKELGFAENLQNAIKELLKNIKDRKDNKKYDLKWCDHNRLHILKSYYLERKSDDEIGLELGFSTKRPGERPRQIRKEFLNEFENGVKICSNLCINDDLKQWIETIKKQCVFNSRSFLERIAGIKDKDELDPLNLELVNVTKDIQFVIPKETKGTYEDLSTCIIEELRKVIVPSTPSSIFEKIISSDKYQKITAYFEEDFIHNVITCPEIVDIMDNGKIRIKDKLQSNEQKAASLLYDLCMKYGTATKKQLSDEYQKRYNVPYTSTSTLKRFGFNPVQQRGTIWHYGGSLPTLLDAVKEYINNNKIFYYNDITSYLEDKGYVITSSIRIYITNSCNVDTKDNQHFCHRDYCDDYPEFSWRSQSRSGLCNWVLNQVNDIIATENEVHIRNALSYIEKQAENTVFARDIRTRASFTIKLYCGDDKPFILENDIIRKNHKIYERTDFETIGLRGEKYAFYKTIRAIVANEIKKREDGRLLLTDAIKLINESIEEQQERYAVIRAIENKHLPDIGLELCTINGNRYIVKSSDWASVHDESVYVVRTACYDKKETIESEELTYQNRPSISYRLTIDWELLQNDLVRELNGYTNLMKQENVDLNDAAARFIDFIRNSNNTNLSSRLPQNLYEFFRARNDCFDRETYFFNLAIFYEGLLYDILKRKGEQVPKYGLKEAALEFPILSRALSLPWQQANGFDIIFKNLYNKRENLIHGGSIDLNSADIAKSILDFTALYIYTVAKYA